MERGRAESIQFDTRIVQNLSVWRYYGEGIDYSAHPLVKILEFRSPVPFNGLQHKDVMPQLEAIFGVSKGWDFNSLKVLKEVLKQREQWTTKRVEVSESRPVVLDRFIYPGFKVSSLFFHVVSLLR